MYIYYLFSFILLIIISICVGVPRINETFSTVPLKRDRIDRINRIKKQLDIEPLKAFDKIDDDKLHIIKPGNIPVDKINRSAFLGYDAAKFNLNKNVDFKFKYDGIYKPKLYNDFEYQTQKWILKSKRI